MSHSRDYATELSQLDPALHQRAMRSIDGEHPRERLLLSAILLHASAINGRVEYRIKSLLEPCILKRDASEQESRIRIYYRVIYDTTMTDEFEDYESALTALMNVADYLWLDRPVPSKLSFVYLKSGSGRSDSYDIFGNHYSGYNNKKAIGPIGRSILNELKILNLKDEEKESCNDFGASRCLRCGCLHAQGICPFAKDGPIIEVIDDDHFI